MNFKDKINNLITDQLKSELTEGLMHDRYQRAHRKKASGVGTWGFTTKKDGYVDVGNDKEFYMSSPSTKLADAAKEAMKALNTKNVYVMEALDPVGKEDDDIDNDGDVDDSDKYLKNRRATIKKAIKKKIVDTKPKMKESVEVQEEEDFELVLDRLLEALDQADFNSFSEDELDKIEETVIDALGVAGRKIASGLKSIVVNKHGNIRGTQNARRDAQADSIAKKTAKLKKQADSIARVKNAMKARSAEQDRIRKLQNESKKDSHSMYDGDNSMAKIGRKMMDMAKNQRQDAIANAYSRLGNALTQYGAPFGPKNMKDLEKQTGLKPMIIKDLINKANKN